MNVELEGSFKFINVEKSVISVRRGIRVFGYDILLKDIGRKAKFLFTNTIYDKRSCLELRWLSFFVFIFIVDKEF